MISDSKLNKIGLQLLQLCQTKRIGVDWGFMASDSNAHSNNPFFTNVFRVRLAGDSYNDILSNIIAPLYTCARLNPGKFLFLGCGKACNSPTWKDPFARIPMEDFLIVANVTEIGQTLAAEL